jgi:DNA-binding transcriptional MocR family regulator
VSTFSKRLIPALRVGFVVAPVGLRDQLLAIKRAMDLGTSSLLQHALAEFLERGYLAVHLRRTLPVYRRRRDAAQAALADHMPDCVRWDPIERGVVLWLELDTTVPADAVYVAAQRQGVLVSPGMLHTVSGRPRSGIRLTICSEPEDRIVEGVRRLGAALAAVAAMKPGRPESPIGI